MQVNTNVFTVACHPGSVPTGQDVCVPGDTGWVQFTYNSDPGPLGCCFFGIGTTSTLCVWNIDLTQNNFNNKSCANVPGPWGNNFWSTGSVLQVTGGEANQTVWVMACPPWAAWAVLERRRTGCIRVVLGADRIAMFVATSQRIPAGLHNGLDPIVPPRRNDVHDSRRDFLLPSALVCDSVPPLAEWCGNPALSVCLFPMSDAGGRGQ
jgi:hypothetical protein